jgi:hypothetical protein
MYVLVVLLYSGVNQIACLPDVDLTAYYWSLACCSSTLKMEAKCYFEVYGLSTQTAVLFVATARRTINPT